MKVLLDTHAFLWAIGDVPSPARASSGKLRRKAIDSHR